MKYYSLAGIALITTSSLLGQACCNGSGGSAALSTPVLLKHDLYVSLLGGYKAFQERKPAIIDLSSSEAALTVAFGITSRLSGVIRSSGGVNRASYYREAKIDTIDAEIALFDTTRDSSFNYKSFGLSDGAIGLQYAFLKILKEQKRELKLSADLGIPWGIAKPVYDVNDSTREVAGIRHSSKAWSGGSSLAYSRLFVAVPMQLSVSVGGRIKGDNFAKTNLGDEFTVGLGSAWNPTTKLLFSLNGTLLSESPSKDSTGTKIDNTGGSRIDLQPAFDILFTKSIRGTMSGKFPIYRDEIQKDNGMKYALSIGFATTFGLE